MDIGTRATAAVGEVLGRQAGVAGGRVRTTGARTGETSANTEIVAEGAGQALGGVAGEARPRAGLAGAVIIRVCGQAEEALS